MHGSRNGEQANAPRLLGVWREAGAVAETVAVAGSRRPSAPRPRAGDDMQCVTMRRHASRRVASRRVACQQPSAGRPARHPNVAAPLCGPAPPAMGAGMLGREEARVSGCGAARRGGAGPSGQGVGEVQSIYTQKLGSFRMIYNESCESP